eukprot:6206753-Pleurochrysis_carterae.AAC.1
MTRIFCEEEVTRACAGAARLILLAIPSLTLCLYLAAALGLGASYFDLTFPSLGFFSQVQNIRQRRGSKVDIRACHRLCVAIRRCGLLLAWSQTAAAVSSPSPSDHATCLTRTISRTASSYLQHDELGEMHPACMTF